VEINSKSQKSGDNSLNIQAEQVTVNAGPSIAHIKELALEVFESNFYKLAGVAREIVDQRAKEITDQFLKELSEKNPKGMQAAEDPDFQHSLFIAQKEYARCGDKELGDILVDILVDRSKQDQRSLLQIVLNESLSIAPKLNSEQLDILACCFNVAYTRRQDIQNFAAFSDYLRTGILVFSDPTNSKNSNYKHLEFVGCASIRAGKRDIIKILISTYQAIFCKGYTKETIKLLEDRDPDIAKVHIPCLHQSDLIQASGMDDEVIRKMCKTHGISEESTNQLIQINKQNLMNKQEATDFLEKIVPGFSKFISDANSSEFKSMELTSVGIAIAHAHSRKKAGFDADLSMWI